MSKLLLKSKLSSWDISMKRLIYFSLIGFMNYLFITDSHAKIPGSIFSVVGMLLFKFGFPEINVYEDRIEIINNLGRNVILKPEQIKSIKANIMMTGIFIEIESSDGKVNFYPSEKACYDRENGKEIVRLINELIEKHNPSEEKENYLNSDRKRKKKKLLLKSKLGFVDQMFKMLIYGLISFVIFYLVLVDSPVKTPGIILSAMIMLLVMFMPMSGINVYRDKITLTSSLWGKVTLKPEQIKSIKAHENSGGVIIKIELSDGEVYTRPNRGRYYTDDNAKKIVKLVNELIERHKAFEKKEN